MRFEFLFPGKTKERYLVEGIAEYAGRLSHYIASDIKILRERKMKKGAGDSTLIERESQLLLQSAQGSYIVCLDRSGRQMDSPELAARIENWEMQGLKKITFIIGGPLGLSAAILSRADLVLSMSPMTFTHEMCRLLLMEQLYRACTIRAGEKYHK